MRTALLKITPLTITFRIAEALGLPGEDMVDALQMVRYKAVAEIVSSYINYTKKYEEGQKEFFAAMIIRVILHDKFAIDPLDIQKVVDVIQAGEEDILQEIREQRKVWRETRKTKTKQISTK